MIKHKLIFLLMPFIYYGCNHQPEVNRSRLNTSDVLPVNRIGQAFRIINCEKAKEIDTDGFLSMLQRIVYIPLDSKESIGEITKMIVTKDRIFVLDSFVAEKIFVFDNKGHLIFLVQSKGQGPEEYSSLWDMQVDTIKNEIIVNDALTRSYIYYSAHDGSFIKRVKGIANCYVSKMNGLYVNLLANDQDFNEEENFPILITKEDSIIFKGFELEPIQRSNYIVNSLTVDYDGGLLYTPINSDTIYQLNPDCTFFPKYVVSQKKSVWNKKNEALSEEEIAMLIKESNYTRYCGNFRSTENTVIFSIQHKWNEFITSVPYIWDKKNDLIYKWNVTPPSTMRDIIVSPVTTYGNTYYGVCSIIGNEFLQSYEHTLNPALKDILKKSDSDSNPILVQYELDVSGN